MALVTYPAIRDAILDNTITSLPSGTLIAMLSFCIAQRDACLDNSVTREFEERAEIILNARLP